MYPHIKLAPPPKLRAPSSWQSNDAEVKKDIHMGVMHKGRPRPPARTEGEGEVGGPLAF